MAITASSITTSNTLEQFRTEFNNLVTDVTGLESGTLAYDVLSAVKTNTTTLSVQEDGTIIFEGATSDAFETTISVIDPTADRTINFPNESGTVFLKAADSDDLILTDGLQLKSDGATIKFGADLDTILTHTDGTGLTLNSTNKLTFGDAASFVQQSSNGVLRIDGEATIDLNASTAVTVSNDLKLDSDAAVLGFGADNDVTLTHVADTGLLLNGTSQLQFNDASQNITAPSGTVLDINATDEVEINATLADINANLDVSGTYTGGGLMTTGGNIVIPDAGNIGSASDTDAISISSGGVVNISATTANTSASDGALTVAGGAGIAADLSVGDDLRLISDSAVLSFGADSDTTLTHTDGTGLTLNSTNKLTFGDTASFVQQSGDGVLRIDGEATIDLNASTAVTVSNDLKLDSDAAVVGFGADNDVTLTHVADTGVTLSAGDNDTTLQIDGNASDSGGGPKIILNRTSDSPADNDFNGTVIWNAENDNNQQFKACQFSVKSVDVSDGTEDSEFQLATIENGTEINSLVLQGSTAKFPRDGHIVGFGADSEVSLTHVADTGLILENTADSSINLLQLLSDDASASAGPYLRIKRTSDSPADNDNGGIIVMDMENDNNQQFDAVQMLARANDVSDGSETSQLFLATFKSGTLTTHLKIGGDNTLEIPNDGTIGSASDPDAIKIDSDGRIGLNQSPSNTSFKLQITPNVARGGIIFTSIDTGTNVPLVVANNSGTTVGSITNSTTATAFNTSSDYRLKENIVDISDGITRLKQLKPKRFNFKINTGQTVDGFLAHEVTSVPEAITGAKDAVKDIGTLVWKDKDGNVLETRENVEQPSSLKNSDDDGYETWSKTGDTPDYQSIDQSKLVPLLTAALQEAVTKIEALETRVKTLEDA